MKTVKKKKKTPFASQNADKENVFMHHRRRFLWLWKHNQEGALNNNGLLKHKKDIFIK